MTVTSPELFSEPREIVVKDEAGPLQFRGQTIADLSWSYTEAYERGHNRWTDMTLYRVLEKGSPYNFALHVVGRSVVYHRPDSPCRRGIYTPVGLIRQDDDRYQALVSCDRPKCNPVDLEELSDNDMVAVEEDLPALYRCVTADEVIKAIKGRTPGGELSGLSVKLLQTASRDPEIAEAMLRTRRL